MADCDALVGKPSMQMESDRSAEKARGPLRLVPVLDPGYRVFSGVVSPQGATPT
jgi:hypothetical protein